MTLMHPLSCGVLYSKRVHGECWW